MHNLKNLYRGSLGGHVCLQCRRYATKKTHYEILGVSKTATEKEIKSAYIELSKKYHPDTSGTARSKRKFTEINEAYSVLGKPLSRREYDNEIAFKNAQTSSSNTYGPHSRPPGSGPGGPPPPGYQYRQGYDQQSKYSSDYSSYEEYRRREMEAIRKLRQKMEEDRIRKFREFERKMSKMSSVGRRMLNVYLRFLYVSAFFMVIYAATSVVPSHRWGNSDSDTDRSNDWRPLYRKSRVMQTQMMWSILILIFQFLVWMMIYIRSNSVGGRTFRHPPENTRTWRIYLVLRKHRTEIYHSINLASLLLAILFGIFVEKTPEEVKEFYRRMGYNVGQEDSNPNYKSNRESSEGVETLFRMVFVQLALVMFIVYMGLRYMVISKALQTQRALQSQRLEHERRDDSELRQRFYHFYGEDGKENRRRAREASYKEWSKEENQREFRRLTAGLMLFALFMTVAKAFASGQMEVPSNTHETGSPVTSVLLGLFCLICLSTTFVYKNTSWRLVNVKKLEIRRKELSRSPSDEPRHGIDPIVHFATNVLNYTYGVLGVALMAFYFMRKHVDSLKEKEEKRLKEEEKNKTNNKEL